MIVRKVWVLRGPNVWAHFPVLETWLDLGDRQDTLTTEVPGFMERLTSWLAGLPESGRRTQWLDRLRHGTGLAEALAGLALELQALNNPTLDLAQTRATAEKGVWRVAVQYDDEDFGKACIEAAVALLDAALDDRPYDPAESLATLRQLGYKVTPGPHVAAFLAAAKARGIPVQKLAKSDVGNVLFFGQGTRQRRVLAARTDKTGAIAESIAGDKALTKSMLHAVGVPVPEGREVANADDAWAAAIELGLPAVVKPLDADHGHGVALNLSTREQVVAAYDRAREYSSDILVERFIVGDEHRVLVVGGKVVAAVRRDPPQVVGDGRSTIAELVEEVNRDPRRGDGRTTPLTRIPLDESAHALLAEQGCALDSVPPEGTRVLLRRNSHRWSGGTTTDVTDRIHPDVAARVAEGARVIGLDIAGLDVLATDISRPLEEQGGVVVEVNPEPSLVMHLRPTNGPARPVCEAILATMFAEGDTGRIPIVAVTGTNGKTTTTRLIAHLLAATGQTVGMTCTDGIFVNDRRIEIGDCSGPQSARTILMNPNIDRAVLETARGGILTGGLGFDECSVAVVTNLGEGDHVGRHGIETVDEMATVKRIVVEVAPPAGTVVLNAGDPLVAAMADSCRAPIIYFARQEEHPLVVRHRSQGGRAVLVRGGVIVLAEGDRVETLIGLAEVPMTHQGRAPFQIENVLAATAAAWASGLSLDAIAARLASFPADADRTPGRFNVVEVNGATLIVDYAHNASALEALVKALDHFPNQTRLIAYSGAGSRRDADILRQGQILGEGFDRVVLYEDQCNYGRADGSVIALLRQGLAAGSRVTEIIESRGEFVAIEAALQRLEPGSLVVFCPESIEDALAFVRRYLEANPTPTAR